MTAEIISLVISGITFVLNIIVFVLFSISGAEWQEWFAALCMFLFSARGILDSLKKIYKIRSEKE